MPKNKPREEKKPIGERISALLARTIRGSGFIHIF